MSTSVLLPVDEATATYDPSTLSLALITKGKAPQGTTKLTLERVSPTTSLNFEFEMRGSIASISGKMVMYEHHQVVKIPNMSRTAEPKVTIEAGNGTKTTPINWLPDPAQGNFEGQPVVPDDDSVITKALQEPFDISYSLAQGPGSSASIEYDKTAFSLIGARVLNGSLSWTLSGLVIGNFVVTVVTSVGSGPEQRTQHTVSVLAPASAPPSTAGSNVGSLARPMIADPMSQVPDSTSITDLNLMAAILPAHASSDSVAANSAAKDTSTASPPAPAQVDPVGTTLATKDKSPSTPSAPTPSDPAPTNAATKDTSTTTTANVPPAPTSTDSPFWNNIKMGQDMAVKLDETAKLVSVKAAGTGKPVSDIDILGNQVIAVFSTERGSITAKMDAPGKWRRPVTSHNLATGYTEIITTDIKLSPQQAVDVMQKADIMIKDSILSFEVTKVDVGSVKEPCYYFFKVDGSGHWIGATSGTLDASDPSD